MIWPARFASLAMSSSASAAAAVCVGPPASSARMARAFMTIAASG